jgi:hypothetical protein
MILMQDVGLHEYSVSLDDLLPPKKNVECNPGNSIDVFGLSRHSDYWIIILIN